MLMRSLTRLGEVSIMAILHPVRNEGAIATSSSKGAGRVHSRLTPGRAASP